MLIHTRPRCNLSEPDRATNAPHPHPEEWTVRVTGTDGVEVAAAAFKAGAQLCQTRRGWNWFRCTPAALAVLREDHVVALADIATWAALVRPPTAEEGEPASQVPPAKAGGL